MYVTDSLARQAKVGFEQFDKQVKITGFDYARRQPSLLKALRNTDRTITKSEDLP